MKRNIADGEPMEEKKVIEDCFVNKTNENSSNINLA